jgi:hypothetical protein
MKTRLYAPEDYPVFAAWWPAHGWPAVPVIILPKCGVVVESDEGTPRAVAWLYMDNSVGVASMEWTVTNPENTPKQSFAAVSILVGAIKCLAIEFDYGVVITSAKQDSLVRTYERTGFTKTDEGMTHLVMLTKPQTAA